MTLRSRFSLSPITRIAVLSLAWLMAPAAFAAPPLPSNQESTTVEPVRFETGKLVVPTYTFSRRLTLAPLFQSSGEKGLYPYTSFDRDSLSAEPVPVEYEALTLENRYLKLTFLPELGGRIWSARDKIHGRDLFYNPGAVKPTSYNQRGAWPAGNLEVYGPYDAHMLTWPGEAWAWASERQADGSVSVTLSHIEHFFRNKISLRVTLYPDHSFIELSIRLHNRTTLPNRYLLWTNAGLPATEGTRFLYPMTKTIGHDSAALGTWPVYDGTDLSWYKNNRSMLGVFGLDIYDNFMGAYDYDADHGTFCYANRNLARGIKTWTWGVGQVGLRHIEQYSDTGQPYIEVQSGRFVWDGNYEFIDPGQSDGWTEYWFGVDRLGGLTTASRDVALNLQPDPTHSGELELRLTATGDFPEALLSWSGAEGIHGSVPVALEVGAVVRQRVTVDPQSSAPTQFRISTGDRLLLDYTYRPDGTPPPTEVAQDFIPRTFGPSEQLSAEALFQKGVTLEKLGRLPEAEGAYREALDRDPNLIGPNLQLGLLAWRRLEEALAARCFERVLQREPFNGEALFYLAQVHAESERFGDARRLLYRLLPSSARFAQRDSQLANLSLREGDYPAARRLLEAAVRVAPEQWSVRQAYAFALRKLALPREAAAETAALLAADPTNAFARAEQAFSASWTAAATAQLDQAVAHHSQGYLELAADYLALGAWPEADAVLDQAIQENLPAAGLLHYYRAFACLKQGKRDAARDLVTAAARLSNPIEIFPFRRETAKILRTALDLSPNDPNAATLLGILLYERSEREEARRLWTEAIQAHPNTFAALQHLGWALVDEGRPEDALDFLRRAAEQRPGDLGTATGLARLYARTGQYQAALQTVTAAGQENPDNDQLVELKSELLTLLGRYDEAAQGIASHRFNVRHQSYSLLHLYQAVHLLKAFQSTRDSQFEAALSEIRAAGAPPESLGSDDFTTLASSRLLFFQALTQLLAGDRTAAASSWRQAAETTDHDTDGEGLFRAIGLFYSGKAEEAGAWFDGFEAVNRQRQSDNDPEVRTHALYLAGIYAAFREEPESADRAFRQAIAVDESALAPRHALAWMEAGLFQRSLTAAAQAE